MLQDGWTKQVMVLIIVEKITNIMSDHNSITKPKITDKTQPVICVPAIAATFLEGLGLEDPAAEV
jgi:hypothetical protein